MSVFANSKSSILPKRAAKSKRLEVSSPFSRMEYFHGNNETRRKREIINMKARNKIIGLGITMAALAISPQADAQINFGANNSISGTNSSIAGGNWNSIGGNNAIIAGGLSNS